MSLTELENLHKRISEMSISEFEAWLDFYTEEAYDKGYDNGQEAAYG